MQPIPVRPYPVGRSFRTIEAAVQHAFSHPLLPAARRDAARLRGAAFGDARWTLSDWWLRFDCDLTLHVWADPAAVHWTLGPSVGEPIDGEARGVGAPPVVLDFGGAVGLWTMDASELVAKRRGAVFHDLFVSDHTFFVYLRGHLILQLNRVERTADGGGILSVCEDD